MRFFQFTGTILDQFINSILITTFQLMDVVRAKQKAEYVVVSSKIIQIVSEFLNIIDSTFGQGEKKGANESSVFSKSILYKKILLTAKNIKINDINNLLVATKLNIGVNIQPLISDLATTGSRTKNDTKYVSTLPKF